MDPAMNNDPKYDHIDRELSRTYFGGNLSTSPVDNTGIEFDPGERKTARSVFLGWTLKIVIAVVILAVASGAVAFFLRGKKIFFTVVDKRPEGKSAARTVSLGIAGLLGRKTEAVKIPRDTDILFDFESIDMDWEIPSWASDKSDHVARDLTVTQGMASEGKGSIELYVDFPKDAWTAAYIEITQNFDLSEYSDLAADIYIPDSCPKDLRAKFIVTVGKDWRFVEMSRRRPLVPGKWTTITADISDNSHDWQRTVVNTEFRKDIRKLGIRIEANAGPSYSGPIYVDNIRVWRNENQP